MPFPLNRVVVNALAEVDFEFKAARRFADKLMRKDMNLYIILTSCDFDKCL